MKTEMKELNNILSDEMKQLMNEYGTMGELIAYKAIELHPQLKEQECKLATFIDCQTLCDNDGKITYREVEINDDGATQYFEYLDLIRVAVKIGIQLKDIITEALVEMSVPYIYDLDILGLCEMSKGTQFYKCYEQIVIENIYEEYYTDDDINEYLGYFGDDSKIAEAVRTNIILDFSPFL